MSKESVHIVVVDDDPLNLEILIKNLKDIGYSQTTGFESPIAAWEYIKQHPKEIQLILLDKMMPGLSGIELLERIKAESSLQHIPVVIQSGLADTDNIQNSLDKGAICHLSKPFSSNELAETINQGLTQ